MICETIGFKKNHQNKTKKISRCQNHISSIKPVSKNSKLDSIDTNGHYLNIILDKSQKYLKQTFNQKQYKEFLNLIKPIYALDSTQEIVKAFEKSYYDFVKKCYQETYPYNKDLESFLEFMTKNIIKISKNPKPHKDSIQTQKIIWGDCLQVLKAMKSESIGAMVTSPPYYNARDYAQYKNLQEYLDFMEEVLFLDSRF